MDSFPGFVYLGSFYPQRDHFSPLIFPIKAYIKMRTFPECEAPTESQNMTLIVS